MRILLLSLTLLAAACTRLAPPELADDPSAQRYALHGEIVSLSPGEKLAVIKHEKIEGWMEAMTMDFPVKERAEFEKLKPGAKITAKVFQREKGLDFWIGKIQVQRAGQGE